MGIVDTNCDCENCRAKRAKGSNQSPEEEKKEGEEKKDVQICQIIDDKKNEKAEVNKAGNEEKKE